MASKPFSVLHPALFPKCPKCGNQTNYVARSNQFAEDCCEIWVECACGYSPGPEHRREDVWGDLSQTSISVLLDDYKSAVYAQNQTSEKGDSHEQ